MLAIDAASNRHCVEYGFITSSAGSATCAVQELPVHVSLSTTRRYTAVDAESTAPLTPARVVLTAQKGGPAARPYAEAVLLLADSFSQDQVGELQQRNRIA